jgi:hypothetical protein
MRASGLANAREPEKEESDTGEQLIGGLAVGILAAGVGYTLGARKTCKSDLVLCKKGEIDPFGPLIGAGYGGGGAAVLGMGVAILSETYRVGGLATSAGGVIGFVLGAFTWKRKHADLGFTRPST